MTLDNIDTSKFLADPKSKTFEKDLIKRSKVFDIKVKGAERKQVLTYLVCMYDSMTELRRNIKELAARKREAGIIAGFNFDEENGFDQDIENLIVGDVEQFNHAVVEYLFYNYDRDFIHLIILEMKFPEFMKSIQTGKWAEKTGKMINDFKADMERLEERLYGGSEVLNMRTALRQGVSNLRPKVRIEDQLVEFEKNGLRNWSPYGPNYVVDKITFAGE